MPIPICHLLPISSKGGGGGVCLDLWPEICSASHFHWHRPFRDFMLDMKMRISGISVVIHLVSLCRCRGQYHSGYRHFFTSRIDNLWRHQKFLLPQFPLQWEGTLKLVSTQKNAFFQLTYNNGYFSIVLSTSRVFTYLIFTTIQWGRLRHREGKWFSKNYTAGKL